MAIRASIGFAPYRPECLESDDREALALWRGYDCGCPCFIDPCMLNELTSYLLDRAEPGSSNDRRFFLLRQQLVMSARAYHTADGHDLLVLGKIAASSVLKRLADFDKEDRQDLRSLSLPLSHAMASIGEDGVLAEVTSVALSAWAKAADALNGFLSKPRRTTRFALDDMLASIDGLYALIDVLELYRRLLLAAGRAIDILGAATVSHHDFQGLEDAVDTWRVSQGEAARQIGLTLNGLALLTPGIDAEADLHGPISKDGSWILSHSRLGQRIMEWALGQERASLNFAAVGAAWPGPAIYGFDDGEEEPAAACALLRELSGDTGKPAGMLYGTEDVVVAEDFTVTIPERMLEGDRRLYVISRSDEYGSYLTCVTERRRAKMLAGLIADEQAMRNYAWAHARERGDVAQPEVLNDLPDAFEDEFSALAVETEAIDLDASGRLPLSGMAFDGLEKGAELVIVGEADVFHIVEKSQEERRGAWAEGRNPSDLYFGD